MGSPAPENHASRSGRGLACEAGGDGAAERGEAGPARWDFLPAVKGLMGGQERGYLAGWTEPSRPLEHSAVLAPSRTLRAGAERRGRCAASWTALARGTLLAGRSGHGVIAGGRSAEGRRYAPRGGGTP